MRLSLGAVAVCAVSAQAFKNTSPFVLLSSTPLPDTLKDVSTSQLQSSADVLAAAKEVLSKCAVEKYYIVSQPELTVATLSKSALHIRKALKDKSTKASLAVSEVVGLQAGDRDELVKYIQEKCGAKISNKFVENARYGAREFVTEQWEPMIGGWTESEEKMGQSDPGLQANVLQDLAKHHLYTFILLSTPSTKVVEVDESPVYEATFDDSVHMDLKRSLYPRAGGRNSSIPTDTRPLFEKYQFLTPGLFMGLLVGFVLLSILYLGLNAISSLQVSYAAFDKEMGPTAHKKAQ